MTVKTTELQSTIAAIKNLEAKLEELRTGLEQGRQLAIIGASSAIENLAYHFTTIAVCAGRMAKDLDAIK